ncbi:hypothetical protein DFH06DRAFT_1210652 [Mycena polygramma]|nr:hypothetical protein DFH06DRAFT_1210652 [Mycena polygramma]
MLLYLTGATIAGSSINSLGDITTSSTPLPSSVVRATSEPLHSSPTEPACMKRAATMDSAVSVPRRNAARRIPNRKGIFSRSLAERGAISSSTTHGPRIIDAGSGFPVYEATSVATSVIYWPEIQDGDGGETGRTDSTPQPSAGVEEFEKRYLHGGSILEIYQPTTSLAWLEENYDHPIVKLIRKKYGGPLAEMLFPDTPALTIFGPHNEEKMARCAQRLADESRFPVISRPTELDPMLRFRSLSADIGANGTIVDGTFAIDPVVVMTAQITDSGQRSDRDPGTNSASRTGPFNGTDPDAFQRTGAQTDENLIHLSLSTDAGETQSNNHSNRSETGDSYTSRASTYTAVSEDSNPEFNGGAGDPDDDGDGPGSLNDKWEEWVSPVHEKRTDIEIRTPTFPVHLEIVSKTQFKTHPDGHAPFDPRTKFRMTRPQAEAHTKLTVGFHTDEVVIDTSFAELGLKAHRPGSISSHENLDCGFNEPTIAFKHSYTEDDQSKFNASLGISGSIPTPDGSVGYEHGHSTSHTMEAVDSQPVPLYDVRVDLGESYLQKNGASYTSYKYGYRAKRGPFWKTTEAQPCPLDVGFAVGINFFARNKQKIQVPPPQVSCINRNQIHIWVKDPSLRSAMRGFVLLLSTNMPDIRRRSEIGVSGILTCDIETGKPLGYEAVQEDEEVGISMAVVTTKKAKYKPQRKVERTSTLKRLRKKVLRKIRPDPPQITLSPQECVRRGWDVTNNEWRDAIYPELDKHFQRPATPDPYLVAFKIAPFPL